MSHNINVPGQILEKSIKLESTLDKSLQTLKKLYDSIQELTPTKSRRMYDKLWNSMIGKENELNGLKNDLTTAVIHIYNSINKTSEFHTILNQIQQRLNIGKIGKLEGILRDIVNHQIENGLLPAEYIEEKEKEILKQPYNESEKSFKTLLKEISVGGGFSKKRKSTKSKDTKRKSTKTQRFHKFVRK
jgi:hypothetical protein